ncbi:MAG: hypothetical protein ABIF10_03860 [Candidatus Woesearchaeota archaeon]
MKDKDILLLVLAVAVVSLVFLSFSGPGMISGQASKAAASKECRDGKNNDFDPYTDYPNDPGCSSFKDTSELNPNLECDDGIDNDYDLMIDMQDSGCLSPRDTDESDCGDGVCEGFESASTCSPDCGVADSCADTDNGRVVDVAGTCSGYLSGSTYSVTDYCLDPSTLREYYCSGVYQMTENIYCGSDSYGPYYCIANSMYHDLTDSFCAQGRCGLSVTPQMYADCDSYDGYGPYYCNANSVYRDYLDSYCSQGNCLYASSPQLVQACGINTCLNGTCVSTNTCIDTDGGLNALFKGTVSGVYYSSQYNYTDYCLTNDTAKLVEYYCSGSMWYNYLHSCNLNMTTHCYDGRCY